jgi:hypothetical protein
MAAVQRFREKPPREQKFGPRAGRRSPEVRAENPRKPWAFSATVGSGERDYLVGLAEGMGFEPTIRCYPYNGLANRRLQPLGHPSTVSGVVHGACGTRSNGRPEECQSTARGRCRDPREAVTFYLGVIHRILRKAARSSLPFAYWRGT